MIRPNVLSIYNYTCCINITVLTPLHAGCVQHMMRTFTVQFTTALRVVQTFTHKSQMLNPNTKLVHSCCFPYTIDVLLYYVILQYSVFRAKLVSLSSVNYSHIYCGKIVIMTSDSYAHHLQTYYSQKVLSVLGNIQRCINTY